MLNQRFIAISPLTEGYIKNFQRPENEYGVLLTGLGLILMKPRMENYRGIKGRVGRLGAVKEFIESAKADTSDCPGFYYYCCNTIDDDITNGMSGFEELVALEKFIKQEFKMQEFAAYRDKEHNVAYIFSPTGNFSVYNTICAFLPVLYSGIFENNPLNEDEVTLLKSLTHNSPSAFLSNAARLLEPYKREILRTELNACIKAFREGKLENLNNQMEEKRNAAEGALQRYSSIMTELEDLIIRYEGMKVVEKETEEEKEFIDYVTENNRLHNVNYSNGVLTFDAVTQLMNFDVIKWNDAVRRKEIYDGYRINSIENPFNDKQNIALLLNSLFGSNNPQIAVNVRGRITLNFSRNYMDTERRPDYSNAYGILKNALTNPHFDLHACPGRNREQIIRMITSGDYVGAVECSIASVGSVNIGETDITFRPFVANILNSEDKIIHLFEKNLDMTPAEALLWLRLKQEEDKAA